MGPSPIRSVIDTVIIGTMLNLNGGNNGHMLNKNAFQWDVYRPLQWACPGMGCLPGGCLPDGLSAQGGICSWEGEGCLPDPSEQNHRQV